MSLNLKDYIVVVKDAVPDSVSDLIISEYSKSTEWNEAAIADQELNADKEFRNCDVIEISKSVVINFNPKIRTEIDQEIFKCVSNLAKQYIDQFNCFSFTQDSGYQLLRYQSGGFYKQHADVGPKLPSRELSCSLALNDDFDGGEFAFFDGEVKYSLSKGSAILFPSNFMYPHQITPVIRGERYSIVTWLNNN